MKTAKRLLPLLVLLTVGLVGCGGKYRGSESASQVVGTSK